MKNIIVIVLALTPVFSFAGSKKMEKVALASVGFRAPTGSAAPKASSLPEAKIEMIDFPSDLPEVEIPSDREVAATCDTAFLSCMRAGSAFRSQCEVVRRECLTPSFN